MGLKFGDAAERWLYDRHPFMHGAQQMRLLLVSTIALLIAGCSGPGVVPMGRDTYMIAKDGSFTTFGGGAVKVELYQEANAFCESKGKQMMPVKDASRDSGYGRYANAELQFRCLNENDPELHRPTMGSEPNMDRGGEVIRGRMQEI
ncbi:hypothetical protein [Pseudomonas fluorescens]|nr:hypothetical protein [Pseudomonas fluorescens]